MQWNFAREVQLKKNLMFPDFFKRFRNELFHEKAASNFYQNIHVIFMKLQKFEIKCSPYMFTKMFNALQNYCDHDISHFKSMI